MGKNFEGKVGLTGIEFFEEKLELVFTLHIDDLGNEPKKFREVTLNSPWISQTSALEILIDENVVNSLFAALYHLDYSFTIWELLGAEGPKHEYSKAVQMVLNTKVLG